MISTFNINDTYNSLVNPPRSFNPVYLQEYTPHPNAQDVDNGFIMRYFTRQANHLTGYITEIDEATYQKLKVSSLYVTIALRWVISGPIHDVKPLTGVNLPTMVKAGVVTANLLSLKQADSVITGLKDRLTNLKQYYSE